MGSISILKTPDYHFPEVKAAVERHFKLLDPPGLKPGVRVVIKPNLVIRAKPERAATTHPVMAEAVICYLLERGITDITIAESPGGPYRPQLLEASYEAAGLADVAKRRGVKLNTSVESRKARREENLLCREFDMIAPVLDADLVINLSKVKTHGMMAYSGAVKNLFGCVPGLLKPELHYRFPEVQRFARMLVDLCLTVKPFFTIADGVDCMEGDGPTGGTVHHLGLTAAACGMDIFSLDLVLTHIMGISPAQAPTVAEAISRRLCPESYEAVTIRGDRELANRVHSFLLPASRRGIDFSGGGSRLVRLFLPLIRPLLSTEPRVQDALCIGCGRCAESCPAHTIRIVGKKARINLAHCIRCYCCHELCPVQAIRIKSSRVARLLS